MFSLSSYKLPVSVNMYTKNVCDSNTWVLSSTREQDKCGGIKD